MKASLQLKFTQHLTLTPQLQQSIRLLQLSTLELNQELEQALADNPLLERVDDPLADCVRLDAIGGLEPGAAAPGEPVDTPETTERDAPSSDDFDPAGEYGGDDPDRGDWGDGGTRSNDDAEDDRSLPQLAETGRTLREHLMAQLAATRASRIDRALVELLIDNLDDDGRLDSSLEEIGAMLPEELDIEPEAVAAALTLLQSFDPAGVGARDLPECLLLQLSALAGASPRPAPEALALARLIVRDHLPLLAARDLTRLKKSLHCDDEALRAAQSLIRGLSPHPGAAFGGDAPTYVIPDVIVRRTRGGWRAALNHEVLPKLRINDAYARILKSNRSAGAGLSTQLQEARWLLRNVQQRYDTILRVSQAIVDRQKAFFSHGAVAMRPLVLREIADELGLHESTISRVTTQKYMLTPHGTLELKYFFGSHVATDSGGAASSTAIRTLLRQMVEAEDPRAPLSDSRIAELLGEQGMVVARRTVAKYREMSNIPPVAQRKSF